MMIPATKMLLIISLSVLLISSSCGFDYPFQDPDLPWEDRVDDLVNRLTIEEIVPQTMAIYGKAVPAIPRLGIKPYIWITECMRGQVSTNATTYPHSLGLAASFSPDLVHNITDAIGTEVRARWNGNSAQDKYDTYMGLSCFSPVINIMRHPLWGRNQETYGEDPYLSGQMVWSFVKGLQGSHHRYLKVNAGCKHFSAYAGPENIPVPRFSFNAKVSMRDWRMTYLPAFQTCVNAGTYSIMCSYNAVNGVPSCVDKTLLTDISREEWGFRGYVVSDDSALWFVLSQHHYYKTAVETAAGAINAGCNLELQTSIFNSTIDAIREGKLTEMKVRENVKPLFYTRFRLGEFDPPQMVPYNSINWTVIQSKEHRDLAIKAATMSFVLLKHDSNLLPIKKVYNRMAIVGPMADNLEQLYGDYGSDVLSQFAKTPRQGLAPLASQSMYASGCDDTHCNKYNNTGIQAAVTGSDLVVICLGTGQAVESEGNDRSNIDLPGFQLDLLMDAVYYANGAPVIVLLFNAGPLDITFAVESASVNAIMACFFPAQSTGDALLAALTAADPSAIPAGRLPVTWPLNLNQVPPITDYNMTGHTYRYYIGNPMFPFGYGLSYSKFRYSNLVVSTATIEAGQLVQVSVDVTNLGPFACDEVVQVYISWDNKSLPAPVRQLAAFRRVPVLNSQTQTLHFAIMPEIMQLWMDDKTGFSVPPGVMHVYTGGQQPDQRVTVDSNVLHETFNIVLPSKLKYKANMGKNWKIEKDFNNIIKTQQNKT